MSERPRPGLWAVGQLRQALRRHRAIGFAFRETQTNKMSTVGEINRGEQAVRLQERILSWPTALLCGQMCAATAAEEA
jgi:hypothetical protein